MAISVGTHSKSKGSSASRSLSHTISAGENIVLIAGTMLAIAGKTASLTYNGVSMTQIQRVEYDNEVSQLFYLANPDTGTSHSLAATWGGNFCNNSLMCYALYACDVTDPLRHSRTDSGLKQNTSISLDTLPGDICVDNLEKESWNPSAGSGQTQVFLHNQSIWRHGSSYKIATSSSTTMTWTNGNPASDVAYIAAAIKPTPAAGGSPIYFYFKREPNKWREIFDHHQLGLEGI